MNHGSLYSGIGGWLLAARCAGIENIFTVEIDEFCNKVLKKHFKVEQYRDIKKFNGTKYRGTIDIISTSDPCQSFSFAGKRRGKADDRYLWPETVRIIREIKPAYVVFENVPGFISMAFETVASDLEAEGYTVESFVIPACAVGAWHKRDRLWIIAYANGDGRWNKRRFNKTSNKKGKTKGNENQWEWDRDESWGICETIPDTDSQGLQDGRRAPMEEYESEQESKRQDSIRSGIQDVSDSRFIIGEPDRRNKGMGWFTELDKKERMEQRKAECRLGGMVDGLSPWLHEPDIPRITKGQKNRKDRLKSLGNAIVPQIAYIIFEAIKRYEIHRNDH